jgi:maltose O-acetyltransferase
MSSAKERMRLGEPYDATDPELVAERRRCRLIIERFNATSFGETSAGSTSAGSTTASSTTAGSTTAGSTTAGEPTAGEPTAAEAILRELLCEVGSGTVVMAPFQCDYGWQIRIGARTFINYGAVVLDAAEVAIGDDVQVGPNVQLITALHPLDPVSRRRGTETARPVRIGDGAWLAAGVIVCPGVSIGADTVVGAGSVVTRDMPAGHLCFGNPCRVIRELSPDRQE